MRNQIVSVIIPVYNVEKYLNTCLKSVVRQSYADLEIIIIDDGATDSSSKICDRWSNVDERVNVYHYGNGGLSVARNRGLEKATGEFVVFLDSDDYLIDNAVEEMVRIIEKKDADVVFFNWKNVLEDGTDPESIQHDKVLGVSFPDTQVVNSARALEYLFSRRFENYAPMRMVRRKFYEKIEFNFPEHRLFEDVATTYRVIGESEKVVFLNKKLYRYLQRDDSILKTYRPAFFLDWLEAVDGLLAYVEENYNCLFFNAIKYAYNAWINLYFYSYKFKIDGSKEDVDFIRYNIRSKLLKYGNYVGVSSFPRMKDKLKYLIYKSGTIKYFYN